MSGPGSRRTAEVLALRDGEQRIFFQAGGEWCYLWTPSGFRTGALVPVVIHHHGYTGYVRDGAADWLDDESKTTYLRAVMEGGRCAVAGSHACGNHWGNVRAQAASAALFERLVAQPAIDPVRVGLMGGGLGGLLLWTSVLGVMAGRGKAALVMQANSSLECTIREHRFKAHLLAGHGLPEDLSDEEGRRAAAGERPPRPASGARAGRPAPPDGHPPRRAGRRGPAGLAGGPARRGVAGRRRRHA